MPKNSNFFYYLKLKNINPKQTVNIQKILN